MQVPLALLTNITGPCFLCHQPDHRLFCGRQQQ